MKEMGIDKAALGIRYLIKYGNRPNSAYFSIIKDCIPEIKLWSLLTLFQNNIDDLWQNVPDFIFEDIFLMRKIDTDKGVLDYGRGYFSKSPLSYREQFKRIRDKLAHNHFSYQDGMIYLEDNCDTYFDITWLEQLVLCTISNVKNDFRKGMSDVTTLSFIPKTEIETADFKKCVENGWLFLCKVTLLTNNKSSITELFKCNIPPERCTFDLIFNSIKQQLLTSYSCTSLNEIIQKIMNNYHHLVELELIPFQYESYYDLLEDETFNQFSLQGQLKYYINRLKLEDVYCGNSIILMNLFDILDASLKDIYDPEKMLILRDAVPFLLKVYACILSSFYANRDYDVRLKEEIVEQFGMDVHFVHAKRVYKEYIKVIKRAYEEACCYGGGREWKLRLVNLLQQYTVLLDEALGNEVSKRLFWNIRTAIIHNQIEFSQSQVRLYITGSNLHLKRFSKKKSEWVFKDFKNDNVIWELIMDQEQFLVMLDYLFIREGVPIQINISKYVRRKNKE